MFCYGTDGCGNCCDRLSNSRYPYPSSRSPYVPHINDLEERFINESCKLKLDDPN